MFIMSYASFAAAYRHAAALDKKALAASLGQSGANTANGAITTSMALTELGVQLGGNLHLNNGSLAGKRVFSGADNLADWLGQHFSTPEIIPSADGVNDVAYRLFGRRGIVAFIQGLAGPHGGYIGLLDGTNASALCCAAEIFHPLEVRFWALN